MKKLSILFLFVFFGCKSKELNPNNLIGVWKLVGGNDKIEFIDNTSLFKVILREPNQQPIVGEGLYQYTTFNNEIEILNTLSSCTCSKKAVYFKVFENNTFEIGDFYKSNSSNNTLKFRKQ
ncbi:hypothetical protein [Emticicia sp.]|uniref:hypothetical protein n=1 Tax=Emticicia sp. TaxID=1930953 RepID=UPI003753C767